MSKKISRIKKKIQLAFLILGGFVSPLSAAEVRPNVVVILADDLGYADIGCYGYSEARTPNIDSIAANGTRFKAGYVTAPQCGPSRAGLLTGCYQNRFGFEANWQTLPTPPPGLPSSVVTIAERMKAAGYKTGMMGKWGVGDGKQMHPPQRGFEESLWCPDGAIYFPNPKTGYLDLVRRNNELVQITDYSTDAFAKEAIDFIKRHKQEPFFLYLPFVNPHWPMEAKPEDLAAFADVKDLHRRTCLALIKNLDDNVGRILAALRDSKIEENTLIIFLSDNGGAPYKRTNPDDPFKYGMNCSLNDPCRGTKSYLLEGGIRIPFLVQWRGHLPSGVTYDKPVSSLDITPTALAVAGVEIKADWKLDGVNLVPFLKGENKDNPHDVLYWRFRFPPQSPEKYSWAIRQGDWKLVKDSNHPVALYNIANDIGETKDLAKTEPERVKALESQWKQWDEQNMEPLWDNPSISK